MVALEEVKASTTPPTVRKVSTRTARDRTRTKELFALLNDLEPDDLRRARARDELIELHLPLVEYLARRFRNRGEPLEDLVQVATIGLIKAVDRFDSTREIEFSTYATPTIAGEIKRYFRDKGWTIRVPRRLQELKLSLSKAVNHLTQEYSRSPTVKELAKYLEISEEEVLEGIESSHAYSAISLDSPTGDSDSPSIADSLGFTDAAIANVELRESLKPLLAQLTSRERQILALRFFAGRTQNQIATELGVSQMHVSRILNKTLASLREGLQEEETD